MHHEILGVEGGLRQEDGLPPTSSPSPSSSSSPSSPSASSSRSSSPSPSSSSPRASSSSTSAPFSSAAAPFPAPFEPFSVFCFLATSSSSSAVRLVPLISSAVGASVLTSVSDILVRFILLRWFNAKRELDEQ